MISQNIMFDESMVLSALAVIRIAPEEEEYTIDTIIGKWADGDAKLYLIR